jgi:hypothetical protein
MCRKISGSISHQTSADKSTGQAPFFRRPACAYRLMWFSRKIGPMIALSSLIGGAVSLFMKPAFETYTPSIPARIFLYLAPPAGVFLLFLLLNIRMIYWRGPDELDQRIQAQWSERIRACVESRKSQYKFFDIIDYLALFEIWKMKLQYKIRLWDWKEDEN